LEGLLLPTIFSYSLQNGFQIEFAAAVKLKIRGISIGIPIALTIYFKQISGKAKKQIPFFNSHQTAAHRYSTLPCLQINTHVPQ